MKNTFTLFFAFLLVGFGLNAQNQFSAAIEDKNAIDHASGIYEFFVLATDISEDKITKNSAYYVDYFNVKQKKEGEFRRVVVYLNTPSDEMSINVINRLLLSLEISTVNFLGSEMPTDDFFRDYMRKK